MLRRLFEEVVRKYIAAGLLFCASFFFHWKAEFFADLVHGTDYERIMGTNQNEIDINEIQDIVREAIFQEDEVSRIDTLNVSYDGRSVTAEFSATLVSGETIELEVTA